MTAPLLVQPSCNLALRGYQLALVQKVFASWAEDSQRVLLQLPTGGGKTVLFSAIAFEFVLKDESVLVLVHREELLLQAKEKLESVTGMPVGAIKAGYPANPEYLIQVASVQTLSRRSRLPQAALAVIDEVQHCVSNSYQKIRSLLRNTFQGGGLSNEIKT